MSEERRTRQVIHHCLANLLTRLGDFGQTTHGRMGPNTLDEVLVNIKRCYDTPTAYTVSDLVQVIDGFLKEEKDT